jgi:hypothetical protein
MLTNDQPAAWFLEPGLSILVGTVDRAGMPSSCRAIALTGKGSRLTVFVPIATSQRVLQDVATTRRLAVTASQIVTHQTVQFKGRAGDARIAADAEQALVQGRFEAFCGVLDSVGVPRRLSGRLAHWPAFAIDLHVEESFDQTPGPHAGTRLR